MKTLLPLLLIVGALAGCGGGGEKSAITLYNGQHSQLVEDLVDAFEEKTGVRVKIKNNSGIALAAQLLQEGSNSPADVFLAENSPELQVLSDNDRLSELPTSITSQIPSQYNGPSGDWMGTARRVSALAYNPSRISAAELPKQFLDLTKPEWKGKFALAPTDGDFPPLVGALIATYGKQGATDFLNGLKANAVLYPDEEAVVSAVERGDQPIGLTNHYYWYRLQLEQGADKTESKLYFFPNRDVGTVQNIAGAAVLASSDHKDEAESFVEFLVSPEGQRILSEGDDFEYPTRPGVARNPVLPPYSQIDPATLSVDQIGNDEESAALIQQVGLA